ncbi:hypothetical protein CEXT_691911 [Caerostris extrusa]|uniref:Secreted protein n=1 Tax=Caerostris extrusa TaxID=172846 RepID=A0AAV4VFU3_CAEEX|nr:hypothetical protein CEXT_691911 [Caerostris extrusa]
MTPIVLGIVLLAVAMSCSEAHQNYYRAAVYEHSRFGNRNYTARLIVETNLSTTGGRRRSPARKVQTSFSFEYGIFPPAERSRLKEFMETVPIQRLCVPILA